MGEGVCVCVCVFMCVCVCVCVCLCVYVSVCGLVGAWACVRKQDHSRVLDVEASQVVGSITEEVQQSEAGCRHHLRNRLVPSSLRDHQTTGGTHTHVWV